MSSWQTVQLVGAFIGLVVAFTLVSGKKLQQLEQAAAVISLLLVVGPPLVTVAKAR
jgi:hypothetical protein